MIGRAILALTMFPLLFIALTSAATQPAFPDTQKNRELVENAWKEYQRIDAEHGHFIEVNGVSMHYLHWGDQKGVPLIWAHGYASTGFELAGVGPRLADVGYSVYSVTYRGHGQTEIQDYDFSLSHLADDIVAMMDKLGIERAVIGGLSLGGGVVTAFYDHYPRRALALVLEDGGADYVQATLERDFEDMQQYIDSYPRHDELVWNSRFDAFQALVGWYLPAWGGVIPPGAAPAIHARIVKREDGKYVPHYNGPELLGEGIEAYDPARGHQATLLDQSWRRTHAMITYRKLDVPMMIIDPTGDGFDQTAQFERLRAMHPDLIDVVEYPDTPHSAHPMRGDWFVRDLKRLLETLQSRGS